MQEYRVSNLIVYLSYFIYSVATLIVDNTFLFLTRCFDIPFITLMVIFLYSLIVLKIYDPEIKNYIMVKVDIFYLYSICNDKFNHFFCF